MSDGIGFANGSVMHLALLSAALLLPALGPWVETPTSTPDVFSGADRPPPVRQWYGWQLLIGDFGLVALTAGALEWTESDAARLGVLTAAPLLFLMHAPIIHALHDNLESAGLSFAMRLAVGGLVAATTISTLDPSSDGFEVLPLVLMGGGLHLLVTMIDATVLGYKPVLEPSSTPMPFVTRHPDGTVLGISGRF